MFQMPGKTAPTKNTLDWLVPFQRAQDLHDQIYCRDVVNMGTTNRINHLVMMLAKYLTHIQASLLTPDNGFVTGQRITDILITATSLLTALQVSIAERLQSIGLPDTANSDVSLAKWLKDNYVYELSEHQHLSVGEVYDRNLQYVVAMPIQIHKCIDAAEAALLMKTPKAPLVNSAMHIWIQAVISHSVHGHNFVRDVSERLREVERRSIHCQVFGLFPDYNLSNYAKTS